MEFYTFDIDGKLLKNPISKFCFENVKNQINSEIKIINKIDNRCKHSLIADSEYVLDQLRFKTILGCENECFIFNNDVFFSDINKILKHKNTVYADARLTEKPYIDSSVFIYTNRDNSWVRYYYELYNNEAEKLKHLSNIAVTDLYQQKGINMNIDSKCLPWKLSGFYEYYKRFPKVDTIYYSFSDDLYKDIDVYWRLQNCNVPLRFIDYDDGKSIFFFETLFEGLDKNTAIKLWKDQLRFIYQKDLTFEEI